MGKVCNSKSQELGKKIINDIYDPLAKCRLQLHFPPVSNAESVYSVTGLKMRQGNSSVLITPDKYKFECRFKDKKFGKDFRKIKMDRIKRVYNIDIWDLDEKVVDEIIKKIDKIEKAKKDFERKKVDKRMSVIAKLLEEQKNKQKFWKPIVPCHRKKKEKFDKRESALGEGKSINAAFSDSYASKENETLGEQLYISNLKNEPIEIAGEEESEDLSICTDTIQETVGPDTESDSFHYQVIPSRSPECLETRLEATPKQVIFKNYKKETVYMEKITITNIGLETIHCRYLGIAVNSLPVGRFPIGVAVRDSAKLRPGLSCSTKVRLYSLTDTDELECSIVYETRRERKPLKHSVFCIPVYCMPARAIIKVKPLKLIFPSLTWCEAISPDGLKILTKIIKIENVGGKACTCTVSKESIYKDPSSILHVESESEESFAAESVNSNAMFNENSKYLDRYETDEFFGENFFFLSQEASKTAESIADELISNVLSSFRFSTKYYIEIPPFSVKMIDIRFLPEYQGYHHEMVYLQFNNCFNAEEVPVELIGNIKKLSLRAEPYVVDMKICIVNSGVYSGMFKLFNDSKDVFMVSLHLPPCLKKHAHIIPKNTIVQPTSYTDFSVRFYPRMSIFQDAKRYFKEESHVLEFPIFIRPRNSGYCKSEFIKAYVFASITNCALELSPRKINLGTVTTVETVQANLELTNHSLAVQEFGFLNLPMGVRIEPNMGFGKILPQETIYLSLLYSPDISAIKNCTGQENIDFEISVTSIENYGAVKEKSKIYEETLSSEVDSWKEYEAEEENGEEVTSYDDDKYEWVEYEEMECFDDYLICDDEFMDNFDWEKERIKEYLNREDVLSEASSSKKHNLSSPTSKSTIHSLPISITDQKSLKSKLTLQSYLTNEIEGSAILKSNANVVRVQGVVLEPYCQLSETVIELPATPCGSLTFYKFKLIALENPIHMRCLCGLWRNGKLVNVCKDAPIFEAEFEFQNDSPYIKLEPQSGSIAAGQTLPITIVYKPEFSKDDIYRETVSQKIKKQTAKKEPKKTNPISKKMQAVLSRTNSKKSAASSLNFVPSLLHSNELTNFDYYVGEKSLQKSMTPFSKEVRVTLLIKTKKCGDNYTRTEIHEMLLVCPVIKPRFLNIGVTQEIRFGKVFIGTRATALLQVQNIDLERISPAVSILNPVGPFSCSGSMRRVEVDPEHIWCQPITFTPTSEEGEQKEFFEIHCGTTNLLQTVSGEGIEPKYKIMPTASFYCVEGKVGVPEEFRIEIENQSSTDMKIKFVVEFLKAGVNDFHNKKEYRSSNAIEGTEDLEKKKKPQETGKNNFKSFEKIPEIFSEELENLNYVRDSMAPEWKVFSFLGTNGQNEAILLPGERSSFKIRYTPLVIKFDKIVLSNIHAIKYQIMLDHLLLLKEFIVLGSAGKPPAHN